MLRLLPLLLGALAAVALAVPGAAQAAAAKCPAGQVRPALAGAPCVRPAPLGALPAALGARLQRLDAALAALPPKSAAQRRLRATTKALRRSAPGAVERTLRGRVQQAATPPAGQEGKARAATGVAKRGRAKATLAFRESRFFAPCPDASGVVRGTETLNTTLDLADGRATERATLRAALAWQAQVGDDARAGAPAARLTLDVELKAKGERRTRYTVASDGRWKGPKAPDRATAKALLTLVATARQTLERGAAESLRAAERRWYDDFACVKVTPDPSRTAAVKNEATHVSTTATAKDGRPVSGTAAVDHVRGGSAQTGSGPLVAGTPFVTRFEKSGEPEGGFSVTVTSRRGRGRADVTINLKPSPDGEPDKPWEPLVFGKYWLTDVKLDGTVWHFNDDGDFRYEGSGTMSYRDAGDVPDPEEDPMKPWDWDFLDPRGYQVGRLAPIVYESRTTGRIQALHRPKTWVCDWVMPEAAKPPALIGILSVAKEAFAGYEVFWSFMPAQFNCPDDAPPWFSEPLPSETLITTFKGGEVLDGENGHTPGTIPIDIDYRWTNVDGQHRVTWKGHVGIAEPHIQLKDPNAPDGERRQAAGSAPALMP